MDSAGGMLSRHYRRQCKILPVRVAYGIERNVFLIETEARRIFN